MCEQLQALRKDLADLRKKYNIIRYLLPHAFISFYMKYTCALV